MRRSADLRAAGLLLLLACAARAETPAAPAAYKVVVHADNATGSLTRHELSAIFLGRKTAWPNGTKAVPIDQVETSPVREAFSRAVHGRRPSAVKSYWLQVLFSGRGVPPVEKAGDLQVLEGVRARAGAVGYVSAGARTHGVKVLEVRP
jgi:ABC-type phosphate transport system substrate-binding protein